MRLIGTTVLIALSIFNIFAQANEEVNSKALKLLEKGSYKEALPIFERLVSENPESTAYRYNRAVVYFNLKRYQDALNDYLILSKEDPEESEYYFQIANLYEALDSLKNVAPYYDKAIELEKDNFMYFFKRGTYWLKNERFDIALNDFNQSLKLNPKHHNSMHNRAIILYKIGQVEKACEDWCQAQLLGNSLSGLHIDKNCKTYPKACLLSK